MEWELSSLSRVILAGVVVTAGAGVRRALEWAVVVVVVVVAVVIAVVVAIVVVVSAGVVVVIIIVIGIRIIVILSVLSVLFVPIWTYRVSWSGRSGLNDRCDCLFVFVILFFLIF